MSGGNDTHRIAVQQLWRIPEGEWQAFDALGQEIYHFLWDDYCDWYVELCKRRLNGEDAAERRTAQKALIAVLDGVLRLMHPIAPFITEEIWQKLKDQFGSAIGADAADGPLAASNRALAAESIMIAPFPLADHYSPDESAEAEMGRLQATITAARRMRAGMNVPPKEATDIILVTEDAELQAFFEANAHYVRSCVPTTELVIGAARPDEGFCVSEELEGLLVKIPLSEDALVIGRHDLDEFL